MANENQAALIEREKAAAVAAAAAAAAKKRPFVPFKAQDIQVGDVVKFSRPGGKISKGVVKYAGPLPDRKEVYFGLELDSELEGFLFTICAIYLSKIFVFITKKFHYTYNSIDCRG